MMRTTAVSPSATATLVATVPTTVPSSIATAPSAVAALPVIAASPTTSPSSATQDVRILPTSAPVPAATDASASLSKQESDASSSSVDLSQAAAAALPPGTTVSTITSIDLAGDGQVQALVTGQETPISPTFVTNGVAALVSWQSNRWNVIYRTPYESGKQYVANIDGFTKTANHPGFVVITSGTHGAASHSFVGFQVFQWEAGKLTSVMERPKVSKGKVTEDAQTGRVRFEAPVYQGTAADCCPSYLVSNTWVWRNSQLQLDKSLSENW